MPEDPADGSSPDGPLEPATARSRRPRLVRALAAAAATTVLVTAASYAVPSYAPTMVGLIFLGATWVLVLRGDEERIRAHGLSLGGLLEPTKIDPRRLAHDALVAMAFAALMMAITFPPFWIGFRTYWHASSPFVFRMPRDVWDELAGQVLVTALPEEAFFRGYLQTALDDVWPPRWRIFGADLGPGWLISAAIFAVGHVLTIVDPARLAVFFPALVFGWLRARTKGIGAGVLFHASCNIFSATLARGYGLSR